MPKRETVGLVVSGAAARGAYEAGALSVLLPELENAQAPLRLIAGTSAGSINAVYLAAKLHDGARSATEGLVKFWQALDKSELIRPLGTTALPALLGYVGRAFYLPTGSRSITTFGRFPAVLNEAIGDWRQIRRNLEDKVVHAVGVVATDATTGGNVVFLQTSPDVDIPAADPANGIVYARTDLTVDHVLASSSVPVVFAAHEILEPPSVRGWYWDGGVRLNTPIAPALAIGADRLVIIATDPPNHPSPTAAADRAQPDFDDALLNVLQATLNDPLIEDLHRLVRINRLVEASGRDNLDDRRVRPYIFAGPTEHGVIGRTAAEVLRERFGGPTKAFSDFAVLNRLLGRQGTQEAELQSYLLFNPEFLRRLIALGREDAEKAWERGWLRDRLPFPSA